MCSKYIPIYSVLPVLISTMPNIMCKFLWITHTMNYSYICFSSLQFTTKTNSLSTDLPVSIQY